MSLPPTPVTLGSDSVEETRYSLAEEMGPVRLESGVDHPQFVILYVRVLKPACKNTKLRQIARISFDAGSKNGNVVIA